MNRNTRNRAETFRAALPALGLLLLTAPALRAQVTSNPLFETAYTQQTGPTTVTSTGFVFDARLFTAHAGDVLNASLTGPAGTTGYTASSTTLLDDQSATFATQTALNTAFPAGTYTTNYSGGNLGAGSVVITLPAPSYAASTPTFSATTYGGFQNLNAAQPLTVTFNAFTGALATNSFVFFNIYNATTNALVVNDGFLPPGTTSVSLPANSLMPGTAYFAQADFSNRIASTYNSVDTTVGFDRVTTLNFTTAAPVPEASTPVSLGLLLALGMGGIIGAKKRRRA